MHRSWETQITWDCHFTYCRNLWTGSLNFASLSSVAMSCLPARAPQSQRGDRLRLLYIEYTRAHTTQQTFSYRSPGTRQYHLVLNHVKPVFTVNLNSLRFPLELQPSNPRYDRADFTRPGTINRFLTFLNVWIRRSQGRRLKALRSSFISSLGWENRMTCSSLAFALLFSPKSSYY